MITCASCKNRTSTDRCTNRPLKGLIFCGTHARTKDHRLWKDVNQVEGKVVLIQKLWKGYIARKWLILAGPGVLDRSICHNEEELISFDDKKSVYPLDYFAFEEAGKVYWFDIRTMIQNGLLKLSPTNPYTREKLSFDTRQRLRRLIIMRIKRKLPLLHNAELKMSPPEIVENIWTAICQIIEENGFPDMSPMYFLGLNRTQLYIFISMIRQDMIAWASEHTNPYSRRKYYVEWVNKLTGEYLAGTNTHTLSYMTAKCLLSMLNDYPEPYFLCFIFMSALHRV